MKALYFSVLGRTHLECRMQTVSMCEECKSNLLLLRILYLFAIADTRECSHGCGSEVTLVEAVLDKYDSGRVFDASGQTIGHEVGHRSCH